MIFSYNLCIHNIKAFSGYAITDEYYGVPLEAKWISICIIYLLLHALSYIAMSADGMSSTIILLFNTICAEDKLPVYHVVNDGKLGRST
ncbi:hypothetical protein T4D_13883 [Trichinella pseudospiralis]|uniref:Uncharacterized protein n=1 Tax=Trichinella pseudospiralis TaxID=6337 RepID=A0A0V1FSX2_TRIPS|nr:hypothetical protein T4D_13883 [Trichinella pseudospiralis]